MRTIPIIVIALMLVLPTGAAGKPWSVYYQAKREAAKHGVSGSKWRCLSALISRENAEQPSTWNPQKWNGGGSGAYGLPQALPGSKMASEGADWRTNPATQVRWMIGYVNARYGGACPADSYQRSRGWY